MIKVEFLESYKHGGLEFSVGDSFSLPENIAIAMVKAGVAKNLLTGEVNEKSLKPVVIKPDNVKTTVK